MVDSYVGEAGSKAYSPLAQSHGIQVPAMYLMSYVKVVFFSKIPVI